MLTLALLLACAGPGAQDTAATGKVTAEDLAEALDRIEALEAEVAALRTAGAPVGIDVDADGDGLREWDGLPVGTRRGDVLYDWTYTGAEDVPPAAPGWMLAQWEAHDEDDRIPLAFDCSTLDGARGDAHWSAFRPPGDVAWPITLHAEDIGLYRVQCIAI